MPDKIWTRAEILESWPQANGELIGFQKHLEQKAGITAAQLGMARQLANWKFQEYSALEATKNLTPLTLTRSDYWQEIETLIKARKLPIELGDHLKALVNAHFNNAIRPTVSLETDTRLIQQAKDHLNGGILLQDREGEDAGGDRLYNVALYIPHQGEEVRNRSFFYLIPRFPGGELKPLHMI